MGPDVLFEMTNCCLRCRFLILAIFVYPHPPDLLQLLADVLITAGDRLVLVVEHLVHIKLVLYFSVFWMKI